MYTMQRGNSFAEFTSFERGSPERRLPSVTAGVNHYYLGYNRAFQRTNMKSPKIAPALE